MIGLSRLFLRRRRQSVATIRTPHSPGHRQVVRFARPKASTVRSVRLWTCRLVHAQGALAQLVARFHGMEEVRGSSPLSSTTIPPWSEATSTSHVARLVRSFVVLLTKLLTNSPCSSGNSASMATAPRVRPAEALSRYTSSVTRVLAWPTRWAMSSIGIPELDSSDTKLWRSSRGVQAVGS